jgi:dephospho-CoA kinase
MCTDGIDGSGRQGVPALPGARRRRPRDSGPPFVVGLVGPAGSGKSTLARSLAGPDVRVLDADRMGHEITDGEPAVRAALIVEYGPAVYRADGTLDRARVAARVFTDAAARARLDALTHPRILERLRAALAQAARERFTGTLLVDAALLLDWGFERECDAVVAVVAPRALQVERLRAKRGWSEEEANRRLAVARPNEAFAVLADEVVVNDRGEAEAVLALREAITRLRASKGTAAAPEDGT